MPNELRKKYNISSLKKNPWIVITKAEGLYMDDNIINIKGVGEINSSFLIDQQIKTIDDLHSFDITTHQFTKTQKRSIHRFRISSI